MIRRCETWGIGTKTKKDHTKNDSTPLHNSIKRFRKAREGGKTQKIGTADMPYNRRGNK